jgi:hypothetical protein
MSALIGETLASEIIERDYAEKEARRPRQKGMAPSKEDTVVPSGEFQG